MVNAAMLKKTVIILGLAVIVLSVFAPMGFAQEEGAHAAEAPASGLGGLGQAGIAIGAGIAIAGGALGTGRAQAGIGAGGTAALAEKPELFGNIFILVALPETMVILGFVLGLMLVGKI